VIGGSGEGERKEAAWSSESGKVSCVGFLWSEGDPPPAAGPQGRRSEPLSQSKHRRVAAVRERFCLGPSPVDLACRGKLFQEVARRLAHHFSTTFAEEFFFGLPSITKTAHLASLYSLPGQNLSFSHCRLLPHRYPTAAPKRCLGTKWIVCFTVSRLGKAAHVVNTTGQLNRRLGSPDGQSRTIFRNAPVESRGLPTLQGTFVHFISLRCVLFNNCERLTKRDRATTSPCACLRSFSNFYIPTRFVM